MRLYTRPEGIARNSQYISRGLSSSMEKKVRAPPPLPVTVLRGHSEGIQTVCFLNDEVLISGCQDGTVKAWNLERRRVCAEFAATSQGFGVLRLDTLASDKIVSQGRDGLIKVWSAEKLADGGQGGIYQGTSGTCPPSSPSVPAPLREVATGAFHFCQFGLTRWRSSTVMNPAAKDRSENPRPNSEGKGIDGSEGDHSTHALDGLRGGSAQAGLSSEGLSRRRGDSGGDADGVVGGGLPEPSRGGVPLQQREGQPSGDEHGNVCTGSFAENTLLAPCGKTHAVQLWDLRDGAPAYTIVPSDAEKKGMVMCVRLMGQSPSCSIPYAICGHDSGNLCFYDLRATSRTALMEPRLHKEPLLCVDIGSSCTQGVSGSADESIHVFRINLQKGLCDVVQTFRSQHPGTACVEIRRDQKLFLSGGWDHRIRAFSWRNPRPLAILRSHDGSVSSIAHSQRIGHFASGSADSRVAIWNVFPDGR